MFNWRRVHSSKLRRDLAVFSIVLSEDEVARIPIGANPTVEDRRAAELRVMRAIQKHKKRQPGYGVQVT
jgi:hypothetical protein